MTCPVAWTRDLNSFQCKESSKPAFVLLSLLIIHIYWFSRFSICYIFISSWWLLFFGHWMFIMQLHCLGSFLVLSWCNHIISQVVLPSITKRLYILAPPWSHITLMVIGQKLVTCFYYKSVTYSSHNGSMIANKTWTPLWWITSKVESFSCSMIYNMHHTLWWSLFLNS